MMFENINITEISVTGRYHFLKEKTTVDFLPRACNGLVYFLSGKIDFIYGETVLKAKKDTFVFLPQGIAYKTRPYETGEYMIINFLTEKPLFSEPQKIEPQNTEAFLQQLSSAKKAYKHKGVGYISEIKGCIFKLLSAFEREFFEESLPKDSRIKLLPVLKYVEDNFLENISIKTLAELTGYSERYFSKLFYECIGMPPRQYIIKKRLDMASDMLLNSTEDIGKIALSCGFSDTYYFSKLFKKHMGISPTGFRREGARELLTAF